MERSVDALENGYALLREPRGLGEFFEYCKERGILPGSSTQKAARDLLDGRLSELVFDIGEMKKKLGSNTGDKVEAASTFEHSDIDNCFWPVLFYKPDRSGPNEERRCWTWPPSADFVKHRLGSIARAEDRDSIYLPTIRRDVYREDRAGFPSNLVLKAAHHFQGYGNDRVISELGEGVGVGCFRDQIIANYHAHNESRDAPERYYDLLLGVVSGIQITVEGIEVRDEAANVEATKRRKGLLVLCSPFHSFFHLLAGCDSPVSDKALSNIDRSDAGVGIADLVIQVNNKFEGTNGPRILNTVGSLYGTVHNLESEVKIEKARRMRAETQAMNEDEIIGKCDAISKVRLQIAEVAQTDSIIAIGGETGTGKTLIAGHIHAGSSRCSDPFLYQNCAAIPEDLLDSQLFGHEIGAFTGAVNQHIGLFERANGGTLFLDEIGEMSLQLQAKLLDVVETGAFNRMNGRDRIRTDVRILTATHRDLRAMVSEGTFREDLYYRIMVVPIELPPLRERGDDVFAIAEYILQSMCEKRGIKSPGFTQEARDAILTHPWPGNIRELRNAIERGLIYCKDASMDSCHLAIESAPGKDKSEQQPNSRNQGLSAQAIGVHSEKREETDENVRQEYEKKLSDQQRFFDSLELTIPEKGADKHELKKFRRDLALHLEAAMAQSPPDLPWSRLFDEAEAISFVKDDQGSLEEVKNFWNKHDLRFFRKNGKETGRKRLFYVELILLIRGEIDRKYK
ncbi:sigma 54-interacting transcriptional regulator [Roseiconus lacunae]|uniref:Sigma-54 dependent transcriptional regulator n=1 Tax=Roseiconus lacunae TaxID=2605694 RepID=A0ABT7PNW1_9BACT|nr:sigma-54 dependent transcriptional regulator [Roseiconus lacunae]MDM4018195.1 sigma-54 dependent transcriptional regulator [Roseiconus lacunae]